MPRPMSDAEKNDAIRLFKRGWTAPEISEELGRDESTIYRLLNEMKDTSPLAEAMLRKSLAGLVGRLVDKAEPSHILDILSRPNIGILEPANKVNGPQAGGGNSIIINVQPHFLAAAGPDYGKQLPEVREIDGELPVREGDGESAEGDRIRVGKGEVFASVRQIDGEPA